MDDSGEVEGASKGVLRGSNDGEQLRGIPEF